MSESETIVTAPATKEKNPKRVAQGKRLAVISKAAKAKKKLMMVEEKRKESDVDVNYKFVFGLIGVGLSVARRVIPCILQKKTPPRKGALKRAPLVIPPMTVK